MTVCLPDALAFLLVAGGVARGVLRDVVEHHPWFHNGTSEDETGRSRDS